MVGTSDKAMIPVVWDRSTNPWLLATILGIAGHRVIECERGAEVVALMRSERPRAR